jgi:hypothetical protein
MLGTRTTRLPDCRPLLAHPDDLTLVFQPIVDLAAAAVAGYEALARFPGSAGPDVWSAAAAEVGIAAELEALAIHKALAAVPMLPPNTFLTVNVSPHILGSAPVQEALATRPDLRRVVVETEHTPVDDRAALRRQTEELRERGALIALDDAGSGYPGLQQLAVPLGQGWLLGRPSPGFAPLARGRLPSRPQAEASARSRRCSSVRTRSCIGNRSASCSTDRPLAIGDTTVG